jgi:hypothetical protein
MPHGKQALARKWPESCVVELVGMVERLTRYCRVGGVEELEGELQDWQAAETLLRRYKPAIEDTSSQAPTHRS